ncbi:hypothetical protein Pint_31446 [Pistacia integerrima]|uniref:Uncharacterized protein n=1 Tax=Pistacia integerrima TaxID=434235 RepID=A0ACC0XNH3_9ROSI|nr:hypothetical protein Pint_31446 [Pistacia integerrima]
MATLAKWGDAVESFPEYTAAENISEIEFDGEIDQHTVSDDCIARVIAINPLDTVMTLAHPEACCIARFSDIFSHLADVQYVNKRQFIQFLKEEMKNFTLQDDQLNSKDDTGVIRGSIIFFSKSFLRVTANRFREDDRKSNLEKAVNGGTINMFVKESSVDSKKFSNILEDDSAHERKQPPHQPGSRNSSVLTMNSRALMVITATIIAAESFTLTSKLPNDFFGDVNLTGEKLQVEDLIYGRLPSYFYLMVFNTAAFINTMFMIALLVRQLHLGMVLVFLVKCMCIVYVVLLNTVIPSFSVGVGTCSISSIVLVWLLVIALTFSGIAIPKYCLPRVLRLFNRLWW